MHAPAYTKSPRCARGLVVVGFHGSEFVARPVYAQ
jgi:hypothetical protein